MSWLSTLAGLVRLRGLPVTNPARLLPSQSQPDASNPVSRSSIELEAIEEGNNGPTATIHDDTGEETGSGSPLVASSNVSDTSSSVAVPPAPSLVHVPSTVPSRPSVHRSDWNAIHIVTILTFVVTIVFGAGTWIGQYYGNKLAWTSTEIAKYTLCADHEELRESETCKKIMADAVNSLKIDHRHVLHPHLKQRADLVAFIDDHTAYFSGELKQASIWINTQLNVYEDITAIIQAKRDTPKWTKQASYLRREHALLRSMGQGHANLLTKVHLANEIVTSLDKLRDAVVAEKPHGDLQTYNAVQKRIERLESTQDQRPNLEAHLSSYEDARRSSMPGLSSNLLTKLLYADIKDMGHYTILVAHRWYWTINYWVSKLYEPESVANRVRKLFAFVTGRCPWVVTFDIWKPSMNIWLAC